MECEPDNNTRSLKDHNVLIGYEILTAYKFSSTGGTLGMKCELGLIKLGKLSLL